MSEADAAVHQLTAAGAIVTAVIWPFTVLFIFVVLACTCGPAMKRMVEDGLLRTFKAGADGVEVVLDEDHKDEVKELLKLSILRDRPIEDNEPSKGEQETVDYLVSNLARKLEGTVLWIDFDLKTSQWEAKALVLLGLRVRREKSEEDAKALIQSGKRFDVIVLASYGRHAKIEVRNAPTIRFLRTFSRVIFYTGSTNTVREVDAAPPLPLGQPTAGAMDDAAGRRAATVSAPRPELLPTILSAPPRLVTSGAAQCLDGNRTPIPQHAHPQKFLSSQEVHELVASLHRSTHSPTDLVEIVVNAVFDSKDDRERAARCCGLDRVQRAVENAWRPFSASVFYTLSRKKRAVGGTASNTVCSDAGGGAGGSSVIVDAAAAAVAVKPARLSV